MFVGKVIGTVWSTVKWPQVQGLKLLVVRPYHLADLADRSDLPQNLNDLNDGTGAESSAASGGKPAVAKASPGDASPNPLGGPDSEAVVCVDLLDAGIGDDVVVAFGHAARVAAQLEGPGQNLSQRPSQRPTATAPTSGHRGQGSGTWAKGEGYPAPTSSGAASGAIVPIDAAVVAIVDSIRVARPST